MKDKYIIFGAGRYGEEALLYYGISNVAYFCDNKKSGSVLKGIEVIDFSKFLEIWNKYKVVLAVLRGDYRAEIEKELQKYGVEYERFITLEKKLQDDNFAGNYHFINRSRGKEQMLMILAGYKEFLWESVFDRVKKYVSSEIDICIMTAGYENETLKQLCEEMDWSYLYTDENKLALVQNITIREHPKAKWIYKMDEDIFLTPDVLEELLDTYQYVQETSEYSVGIVAPLMGVNSYGYQRILRHLGGLDEYEKCFGRATSGRGLIYSSPDAAEFMWKMSLPINSFADKIRSTQSKFSVCPHRFSIGCFLISRNNWDEMGGFKNAPEGAMGVDEEYLCKWCMDSAHEIIVAERAYAGHFAYGPQTEHMKLFYESRRADFDS